jgi:hypothetical protein
VLLLVLVVPELPVLVPELLLVLAPELLPDPLVELLPGDPLLEPPLLFELVLPADPPLLEPPPDDPPDDADPLLLVSPAPLLPDPSGGVVAPDPQCTRIGAATHNPTAEKCLYGMVSTSRGAHHPPGLTAGQPGKSRGGATKVAYRG